MAKNTDIQSKHLFMGALAILGVYVANEAYKKYKLDQMKAAAIAGKGSAADVFNAIAPGVPPTPTPVIVLPPTAGLPPCDQLVPSSLNPGNDPLMDAVIEAQRSTQRFFGKCV